MGITIIPADGPTFYEAFTDQFGRSYEGAADRYQRDKATRIQEALHRDQLTQQRKQFDETQARLKAQAAAAEQYRQDNLQRRRETDAAKQTEAEAKRQQAQAVRVAQQGYVDKYGTDADKAYFSAFGKLPAGHDPGRHTTAGANPEARQITAQLVTLDDQYRYWSAQKKDAENAGDADPDASDSEQRAKRGKENQYRAAVANMMQLEAMQARLRRRAFELAGGMMPVAPDAVNPGGVNPFQTAGPQAAAAPTVKIEDLNVPLPAGVTPFNPQGVPPAAPASLQPVPQTVAPPPVATLTPEQARELLSVSAAKMGKRPDLIQQMPPAPMSKVTEIKALALRQHSDPVAARQLFYDLMILNGFNPLAAPIPDEQYNVNPGGRVEVRVLE